MRQNGGEGVGEVKDTRKFLRLGSLVWAQAFAVLCWAAVASAVPVPDITLVDGSSTVKIDPRSSAGVYSWQIANSASQLSQQWFWFRADVSGWNTREYSLDKISAPTVSQPIPNMVTLTYAEPRFSVELTYLLIGAGDNSDLAEIIKITNHSAAPIKFTLFQYSNFDLCGDTDDERLDISGGNTAIQTDRGDYSLAETVVSGMPNRSEAAVLGTTLAKLEDNDDVDDLDGSVVAEGPADLTWAFEWQDRSIGPGRSLLISKDKVLSLPPVPEPGALVLVSLAGLVALRRRK